MLSITDIVQSGTGSLIVECPGTDAFLARIAVEPLLLCRMFGLRKGTMDSIFSVKVRHDGSHMLMVLWVVKACIAAEMVACASPGH